MQSLRTLDEGLDEGVLSMLEQTGEALELLFDAYAGAMYPPEDEEEEPGAAGAAGAPSSEVRIDRAELVHFLQDFEIVPRGPPPDGMCGVFTGCGQTLSLAEFNRCIGRAALALAPPVLPESGLPIESGEQKLRWLLRQLPLRIETTKLPVLDVQRRVRVLAAAEYLQGLIDV
jgi:hypothetical protein